MEVPFVDRRIKPSQLFNAIYPGNPRDNLLCCNNRFPAKHWIQIHSLYRIMEPVILMTGH